MYAIDSQIALEWDVYITLFLGDDPLYAVTILLEYLLNSLPCFFKSQFRSPPL